MRDLLFDTPWWLFTLLGVAGMVLFISGNARQNKPILRSGLAVILLGALLAVVSYLIDTPKEKVIKGTHAIVNAAVTRDKTVLADLLHPQASLVVWKRQQIIDGAVVYAERFGLKTATITGTEIEEHPGMITATIRVVARFQSQNLPYDTVPTDWQLNWWEMPDGKWLLKDITPLGSGSGQGGLSREQMSKQYFSGNP